MEGVEKEKLHLVTQRILYPKLISLFKCESQQIEITCMRTIIFYHADNYILLPFAIREASKRSLQTKNTYPFLVEILMEKRNRGDMTRRRSWSQQQTRYPEALSGAKSRSEQRCRQMFIQKYNNNVLLSPGQALWWNDHQHNVSRHYHFPDTRKRQASCESNWFAQRLFVAFFNVILLYFQASYNIKPTPARSNMFTAMLFWLPHTPAPQVHKQVLEYVRSE